MLRTVKFLSTFSCVSLRDMKETGAASRPVPPNHSDIRRAQVLQPPDSSSDILRGSSLIAEQSPASSHRPLTGTLVSYINTPVCVKVFFKKVSLFLPKFRGRFWCSLPGGLAGGPRAAPTGSWDRFCKNRRGGCPHPPGVPLVRYLTWNGIPQSPFTRVSLAVHTPSPLGEAKRVGAR